MKEEMSLEKIEKDVKMRMSEKRFIHSQGVKKRIEELAKIYHIDVETAKKVGIAHDVAKEMSVEESMQYVKENGIILDDMEKKIPYLLHGKIGADYCKKKYGFTKEMQKAIEYHTTGNPNMDLLAKILYAADKTEENRKFVQYDIEYERKLANEDIDQALVFMLEETIKYNMEKRKLIHPDSILTRNDLLEQIENKE
ncbi:MAG TPA: bis(5'-nucleosyl)-tetraphosphatase (symmetrical) YqeK [Candidatus Merdicola faecigallinarum]|uniref:bis(5'-nucleosyl)-tetraphosphatase (symmetrical) n=1 Tax=Candidatus Merdicola faecigallinarum TaxID=2840862 RepID=A0A9D1M0D7_9FIRM|nr:bis(5'-nucleosyl)-tetraphosphatase (symmetrical) YqeK [Candidatus Merdicola faecigallinarum]